MRLKCARVHSSDERKQQQVPAHDLDDVFRVLRRRPDVEAPNLQAWDATDRLLLETAAGYTQPGGTLAVIGDRYGALTLGAIAALGPGTVRVHQDLITGERALRLNAEAWAAARAATAADDGGTRLCRLKRTRVPDQRSLRLDPITPRGRGRPPRQHPKNSRP